MLLPAATAVNTDICYCLCGAIDFLAMATGVTKEFRGQALLISFACGRAHENTRPRAFRNYRHLQFDLVLSGMDGTRCAGVRMPRVVADRLWELHLSVYQPCGGTDRRTAVHVGSIRMGDRGHRITSRPVSRSSAHVGPASDSRSTARGGRRNMSSHGSAGRETTGAVAPVSLNWCRERDSNPHGLPRRILSPLRLPFRHPGR
jgi:hypothetical protein